MIYYDQIFDTFFKLAGGLPFLAYFSSGLIILAIVMALIRPFDV